jgi:hypothetical protein
MRAAGLRGCPCTRLPSLARLAVCFRLAVGTDGNARDWLDAISCMERVAHRARVKKPRRSMLPLVAPLSINLCLTLWCWTICGAPHGLAAKGERAGCVACGACLLSFARRT